MPTATSDSAKAHSEGKKKMKMLAVNATMVRRNHLLNHSARDFKSYYAYPLPPPNDQLLSHSAQTTCIQPSVPKSKIKNQQPLI